MAEIKLRSLDELTLQHFEEVVGEALECVAPENNKAELLEAKPLTIQDDERQLREPFALLIKVFSTQNIAQGMYQLSHPKLGTFEIFLVPVEQQQDGIIYEASFG